MKRLTFLVILASVMSGCSKKVVPMQKDWADRLGSKTSEIQYYNDPNRLLDFMIYGNDSLDVIKGVIVSASKGGRLTVEPGTKGKYYDKGSAKLNIKVSLEDGRKIPFVPVDSSPTSFYRLNLAYIGTQSVPEVVTCINMYGEYVSQYSGRYIDQPVFSHYIYLPEDGKQARLHVVTITAKNSTRKVIDNKLLDYVYLYVRKKQIKQLLKDVVAPGVTYDGKDAKHKKK